MSILSGLVGAMGGGYGAGMVEESEEEKARKALAGLIDPIAGINTSPDPGMTPPGERYRQQPSDLRALVSPVSAPEPASLPVGRSASTNELASLLDARSPRITDSLFTKPGMAPQGQRPKASQVAGVPSIDDGELIPGLRGQLEQGMTREYGASPAGAPRLRDITTPTEEADLAPGRGPRSKWGAFGDVLKGILYGLSTGQGAISGAMYGASGQGRRDADKMDRMERIGEITRQRGEQDTEVDRQWKQDLQNAEIMLRQAQTEDERASAWQHYNQVKDAKPLQIHGVDQPMLTIFDPNNAGIRQLPNQGYAGPKERNAQVQWAAAPDGGAPIQVERGEDGKWIPSQGPDGNPIRKPVTGEDRGPTAAELGQRSAQWAEGPEGQKRQAQIRELAEYEALQNLDPRFGVSGANYDEIIGTIEAEAAQPPSVDKTTDPAEWARQKAAQEAAALKLVRIQKARAAAQKIAADRWETERKAAGGGGGTSRAGSFAGVSGWSRQE